MKHERVIIIAELGNYNVTSGPHGEPLDKMDYQSLVRLLAIREAMNS